MEQDGGVGQNMQPLHLKWIFIFMPGLNSIAACKPIVIILDLV